jgi:hypothetical protein
MKQKRKLQRLHSEMLTVCMLDEIKRNKRWCRLSQPLP